MSRVNDLYHSRYSLLPFKNVVIFPRNVVTLLIGRPRSVQAVEDALSRDRRLVVTAHRDPDVDEPRPEELHLVGTLVGVGSVDRQATGGIQVVLEGISRVRLSQFDQSRGFFTVAADAVIEPETPHNESRVLITHVKELTTRLVEARSALPPEVNDMVQRATEPGQLADLLATQLLPDVSRRQTLLEIADPLRRLEHVAVHVASELDVAALERRIKERVRDQIDKNQREYYLREQLKAIHDELGGDQTSEIELLKERVNATSFPAPIAEKVLKEVGRLERMPGVSAEATVVRTYIDTMLALPWTTRSEDQIDLDAAEQLLDADHHGLETVKERILDYLAVLKLTSERGGNGRAQILCLIGPPGVGKTSLGRSIAAAMGRKFVRVSLGGVRDEAEIRGHRRTYIGAMPGRLMSAMRQAGTLNPVILLDEIDKMAADYRGDPASAMLEVLDPEQNSTFIDHYVDAPFDLSQVLFITTANYGQQIPRPLRDRMEIIEVAGYSEEEKVEIGRRHLLPQQLLDHGLTTGAVEMPPKVWPKLVRDYTREAGVRQLNRELATICRRAVREIVRGKSEKLRVTESRLVEYLGPARFGHDLDLGQNQIGLAIGLGVTEIGGELLPVEVAVMPGKGGLTLTGKAGEVMRESAQAALSYARSRAQELRIDPDFQARLDLHIHLPEGATPKDGPSAGITMAAALISALTRRPVRADTAMTGEITLRGRVLAIGGLRDKALAAHRHGVRRLVAPKDNEREYAKLPAHLKRELEFIFVSSMDEVIAETILLDDTAIVPGAARPPVADPAPALEDFVPPAGPAFSDDTLLARDPESTRR